MSDPLAKQQPPLSLLGVMLLPVWNHLVEKRALGGKYIRFGRFLTGAAYLYQTGAIIGYSNRDRMDILGRMIADPGREDEFVAASQSNAKSRMQEFGKQPTSIFDLVWSTELAKVGIALPDFPDFKRKSKPFDEKLPCDGGLEARMKLFALEGMGFGSTYPDLTEKMWRDSYETIDKEKWAIGRAFGLHIPEEPSSVTFEQETQIVREMLDAYASEYYPELMEPLGLPRQKDDPWQKMQTGTSTSDTAPIYCTKCGAKYNSQANYCRICGTPLAG